MCHITNLIPFPSIPPYLPSLLPPSVPPQVPLDGFAALQGSEGVQRFGVHKAFDPLLLPTAHTCFNQLDLPQYPSEEVMRAKLLLAIRECSEGFGFI
jgi:E3 ubiquitin-protein ligase HUWE1